MIRSTKPNAFLSAVFAALPAVFFSSTAHAQYQVGGNGHDLDANNRLGSGGYNGAGTPHTNYNVNNNIVTGNVSGLNYFHGNRTGEFDPNTFSGSTGSSSFENFNAESSPVDYSRRGTGTPNYTQYYNNGNTVGNLPNNYVPAAGNTGYIPAPAVSPLTPTGYDTRLELTNVDPTKGNLADPDELNVAGPVDPSSGNQSMYSMSPLYGVRQSDSGATAGASSATGNNGNNGTEDAYFNSRTTNVRSKDPSNRSTLDPAAIQRMRDELNTTVVPNDQEGKAAVSTPSTPGAVDVNQSQQLNTTATGSGAAGAGTSDQLANQSLNSSLSNTALTNGLGSGQSVQNQLIVPPGKQSKQLEALEQQYKNNQKKLTDVDATKRYNDELRLSKTPAKTAAPGQKPASPGMPGPDMGSGITAAKAADKPAAPSPTAAKPILTTPSAEETQPYVITSLATGISAKGLAQLMKTAEDQMRNGKFTEAVDTYQTAEQVAPNNPFVSLGRGFAELGASYYGKADLDISHSINADPAVLVGRYDLKGFLGEDRLNFVQKDLQDIADHEKGARPLVLMAYIAHNSGDDTTTAADLDEASKRGGYDQLINLMKQAWAIK